MSLGYNARVGVSWLRSLALVGAATVLVLVAIFALLHTQAVRTRALDSALRFLRTRYDLDVRADRIDLNLLTLDVSLHGVELTSAGGQHTPFLSADRVAARLPTSIAWGNFSIDALELVRPRVTIVRDADGVTNLPSRRDASGTDGPSRDTPIRLRGLDLQELDVRYTDRARAFELDILRISANLQPAGEVIAGPISFGGDVRLSHDGRETRLRSPGGRLEFDGLGVTIEDLPIEAPEGRVVVTGRVDPLAGEKRMALDYTAELHLAELYPWLELPVELDGVVQARGRIAGPLDDPETTVQLTGEALSVAGLRDIAVRADSRLGFSAVRVDTLEAQVAGGVVQGRGQLLLGEEPVARGQPLASLELDWEDLRAGALLAGLRPASSVKLEASLTGHLEATWAERTAASLVLRMENRSVAGRRVDDAIQLDGLLSVEADAGRWRTSADHRLTGDVRVIGSAGGRLSGEGLGASELTGDVRIEADGLGRSLRLARALQLDLPRHLDAALHGAMLSEVTIAGTLAGPRIAGSLEVQQLGYDTATGGALTASFGVDRQGMTVASLAADLGENRLRATGRLSFESGSLEGSIDAELDDLSSLSKPLPHRWRSTGSVHLNGTLGGRWRRPTITTALTGARLTLAGQTVDGLSGVVTLEDADALVVRDLHVWQEDGRLDVSGRYRLGDGTYTIDLEGRNLTVSPIPAVEEGEDPAPLRARIDVAFRGTGSTAEPRGSGRLGANALAWSDRDLGSLVSEVTVAERTARFDTRLPDIGVTATTAVDLNAPYRLTVEGMLRQASLRAIVASILPNAGVHLDGSVDAGFALTTQLGLPGPPNIELDLTRVEGAFGATSVRLVRPTRLRYTDDDLDAGNFELRVGDSTVRASGRLRRDGTGDLSLDLSGDLVDVVAVATETLSIDGGAPPAIRAGGPLRMIVRATGTPARPIVRGEVQLSGGNLTFGSHPPLADVALEARYRDGALRLQRLDGTWQGAALSASGEVYAELLRDYLPSAYLDGLPTVDAPSRISAHVGPLTAASLAPYIDADTLRGLEGQLDATLSVEVPTLDIEEARGEIRLDRVDLRVAGVPVSQKRPTRLAIDRGRLRVLDWEWGGPSNDLVVTGEIRLTRPPTIDGTVEGDLDLSLANAFMEWGAAAGRARLRAELHGPAASPTVDGRIELTSVELRTPEPRLAVTSFDGAIVLSGNRLTGEGLEGDLNGGHVMLEGHVAHSGLAITDASLRLQSDSMALQWPSGLRSEVETNLALEKGPADWTLSGAVTLNRGAYRDPLILTGRLLEALDRRTLRVELAGEPSALDRLTLDVRISTDEDLLVDNNYGRLDLAGDLRLRGSVARPTLAGRVEVREGGAIFLSGTNYRIETGVIDFTNPTRIEPDLNLTARTSVSGYDITLRLVGTPDALRAELSSDDPSLDQSDLVSLLLTGRRASESGGAQAEVASAQVLGYLSGELLGTAGRAVGLDVLRIERSGFQEERFDPSLVASETDPSSRLTFGRNVTRNMEVIFSQNLRQSGDLTWIVAYRPRSNIELRAVARDNDDRSYEFSHNLAFGRPGAAATREAATRPPPERVSHVQFSGEPGFPPEELREHLRLTEGDRFDFYDWQADRDRLEGFYIEKGYREVRIGSRRQSGPGPSADERATRLEYEIHRGPSTILTIEGFELPDRVRAEMERAWIQAVFDRFLLEDLERLTRRHLTSLGYLRPHISIDVRVGPAADRKEIVLRLDPGEELAERRLVFEGNTQISTSRLDRLLREPGVAEAAWMDPASLSRALIALYHAEGFLGARIEVTAPVFQDVQATLPVRIDEGLLFLIAGLTVEGVQRLPESSAWQALDLEAGQPFAQSRAEAAARRLDAAYRRAGFNNVEVAFATEVREDDGAVDLTYVVEEGRRQVLHDITVSGAETTSAGVVERALDLEVGEPVDLERWYRARKRLYDTNVFRRADVEVEPLGAIVESGGSGAEASDQPVRARVLLEEWPRVRLRYGFQLNDERPLSETGTSITSGLTPGFVTDLEHRNLLGRAMRTGVSFRADRDQRAARGFISAPTFFHLPITSGLFVSRSRTDVGAAEITPFIADETAVTFEQQLRPAATLRVSYGYAFRRNRTFERDLDPDDPFGFDVTVNTARLTTTTLFDARDDLINATRGWFHSSTFEFSAPTLGSDLRFAKYIGQHYYYHPLSDRVVLASAARYGVADAFGQELIPSERFFAGGGNSVRGYGKDSLGPTGFLGNPTGGETLLILNQEIRFPIFNMLRGVGFVDAGNVFPSIRDLALRDLKASVGFGFRLHTPFVLLRLDYGARLGRAPDDPRGQWFFSIGQMF